MIPPGLTRKPIKNILLSEESRLENIPLEPNDKGLLTSWKEISDYLGVDERTCRRWELSLRLPVHRMGGTSRSRVYAYKDELKPGGTSHLYFELDYGLRLQDIKGSDLFRNLHWELVAAGKIKSELNDEYYQNLKRGVLYWAGQEWTSTPAMKQNGQK